ncbi:MAG: conserved phage C-terminal domain-containing protein [Burkholderiales bacterium]
MNYYSKVSSRFWTGQTGRAIRGDLQAQVVAAYLITSPHCNMLGLYYLPIAYIAQDTGMDIEGASKGLRRVVEGGFCRYDEESEVVWVTEMARIQVGNKLEAKDNRVISIGREFESLPNNIFMQEFFEKYGGAFHLKKLSPFGSPLPSPLATPTEAKAVAVAVAVKEKAMSGKPDGAKLNGHQVETDILTYLNEKAGKHFAPVKVNIAFITSLLKDGAAPDDLRAVVDRKCAQWLGDDKMAQYLRPATLFNRTKFAQYQGETNQPGLVQVDA